jgi:putative ABC transport system substrate-binding protein
LKSTLSILEHTLLTAVLVLCFTCTAHAEYRIGVIMSGDIPYYTAMHEAFLAELNRSVPEGEVIEIILQRPFPDPISWSNAARKLIAFDVNLIVTYGAPATLAVINEKSRIPLVYAGVYDPDTARFEGKNMTGCGYKVPLSSLLRYQRRLQKIETLRVIFSGVEEDTVKQSAEISVLAEQVGLNVKMIDLRVQNDLVKLNTIKKNDAVFLTGSSLAHLWLKEIMSIVRQVKVTSADIFPDITEEGVLMTLFQPAHEQGEMAAKMVLRIMRGEQAKSIPHEIFRDTELVFNLNEAQQIGIDFPVQLIIEATRVIK